LQKGFHLNSIFTKLLLTFLLVMGPLYFIVLQFNRSDAESIKLGIARSNFSKADFYIESLNMEFKKITRYQQDLGSDRQLDTLSNAVEIMTGEEKRQSILSIQRQLEYLKSSSNYIKDVTVFLPLLGTEISANNFYVDLEQERFNGLLQGYSSKDALFVNWDGKLYIPFAQPQMIGIKDPPLLVAIEVDPTSILQTMKQFEYNGKGGAALRSNGGSWMLSVTGDRTLLQRIADTSNGQDSGDKLMNLKYNGKRYIYNKVQSGLLGATFITFMPEAYVLSPLSKNQRDIWFVSAFSLIVVCFVSYLIYRWIHQPLRTFIFAFRQVGNGQLDVSIDKGGKDEFSYLYEHFNKTTRKLDTLVKELFQQKYLTQQAEFKQLQSQINPHFLYNSFFTIYRMAKSRDTANIERFTKFLGDYYRFITRDPINQDEVLLEDEFQHAQNYVSIQQIRFGERVEVFYDELPEYCRRLYVPRLILQPIIENAFHYALENQMGKAILQISFSTQENQLLIRVVDNGTTLDHEAIQELNHRTEQEHVIGEISGLININQRLRLKYGKRGLYFSQREGGGLQVEMRLEMR
jgi:two-component system sensor histidine kinase YesM